MASSDDIAAAPGTTSEPHRRSADGRHPEIWAGGSVRFFRQQAPPAAKSSGEPGAGHWVYQVDTTRPEGDQVYVIHEGEWAVTEYEDLARFLNNTRVFSPGTVHEITAEEAATAHPQRSTDLPAVASFDDDL